MEVPTASGDTESFLCQPFFQPLLGMGIEVDSKSIGWDYTRHLYEKPMPSNSSISFTANQPM